jgi:transcriptional regulator with GAF, ATPase, and Fis domain
MESDLFGHERGSFTGALTARKGVFELADGGTLLIDEIGELELPLQAKLLRALDRSEVRRIGADRPIRVDVRVLCATRRDLDREVAAGRFRDDLFHRLAVARIELPPLRRRLEDVRLLARAFASSLGGDERDIPEAVLSAWEDYAWPGNVRELRNRVAHRIALGDLPETSMASPTPEIEDDRDVITQVVEAKIPFALARERVIAAFEQRYVEAVLAEHDGNVSRAARASGIARRQFQRLKTRSLK